MNIRQHLSLAAVLLSSLPGGAVNAQDTRVPYVRVAQIEIDPAQAERYKAAVKEQIEAAIRLEPGVLTLYAVTEKDNPARVIVFEQYADLQAYQAHLETPHFRKYKAEVEGIVKSLNLLETQPILLGAKK